MFLTDHALPTGGVSSASWSPDGRLLAANAGSRVIVWDSQTGKPLHTLTGHRGEVSQVAWSPDGTLLASGSADGSVVLWETAQLTEIGPGPTDTPTSTPIPPTPYPTPFYVPWAEAEAIILSGEVVYAIQSHSLEVVLTLRDGRIIVSVEPTIDEVFRVVDRCGDPCAGISLATE